MQPWGISAALTTAAAAVLLGVDQLGYLAPFRRVILFEHGAAIGVHAGLALASLAAATYLAARAGGLTDLGGRVDLAELSARRGGEPRARRLAPEGCEEGMGMRTEAGRRARRVPSRGCARRRGCCPYARRDAAPGCVRGLRVAEFGRCQGRWQP